MQLTLYSTLGCHLCDHAKAVVAKVLAAQSYQLHECDIAGDDALLEKYGLVIPVLQFADNDAEQLHWPFDDGTLAKWLQQQLNNA